MKSKRRWNFISMAKKMCDDDIKSVRKMLRNALERCRCCDKITAEIVEDNSGCGLTISCEYHDKEVSIQKLWDSKFNSLGHIEEAILDMTNAYQQ